MATDPVGGRRVVPFSSCTVSSPYYSNPNLMTSWINQPLIRSSGDYGGGSKLREMNNRASPLVSSRWNPTPEQVQALEEMYQKGIRTPSAQQIQQIAAKLRRFGRIEGKNVFYWFQNHKARDRQKLRRQQLHLSLPQISNPKQFAGLSRKYLEMEPSKKLPTMSKCRRSTASTYLRGEVNECKRLDTWCVASNDSSSCMSPNVSMHKVTAQNKDGFVEELESPVEEKNRTLELFPVSSSGLRTLGCSTKEEMNVEVSSVGRKLVPNQFFEFLPTKN